MASFILYVVIYSVVRSGFQSPIKSRVALLFARTLLSSSDSNLSGLLLELCVVAMQIKRSHSIHKVSIQIDTKSLALVNQLKNIKKCLFI